MKTQAPNKVKNSITEIIVLVLLIIYCFMSPCVNAQSASLKKIFFQADAGATFGLFTSCSTVEQDCLIGISPRLGYSAQLAVNIKLGKELALQTGLAVVQHNAVITYAKGSADSAGIFYQKDDMNFTYVQVPVTVRAGKQKGFYGVFGFAIGMPVKVTDRYERKENKMIAKYTKRTSEYFGVNNQAIKKQPGFHITALLKLGYMFVNHWGAYAGFDVAVGAPSVTADLRKFYFNNSAFSLGLTHKF